MAITKTLRDFREIALDRAEAIEEAATATGSAISGTLHQASHAATVAAEKARQAATTVGRRATDGVHGMQDVIAHHPLSAAFLAIGVGFVLAAVALRRRW